MSNAHARGASGTKRTPGWTWFYRMGIRASRGLEGVCTYEQIGEAVGITKQNAYTLCMVALGRFTFRMRMEQAVRDLTELDRADRARRRPH